MAKTTHLNYMRSRGWEIAYHQTLRGDEAKARDVYLESCLAEARKRAAHADPEEIFKLALAQGAFNQAYIRGSKA